jgi:hypothetical protein
MLRQLRLHPLMQPFHQGPTVLLMEAQPRFRRQFPFPRLRVVAIHAAQRLQHIPAFFREVICHLHNLPPSMGRAVRQQGCDALRCVA